MKKIYILLLVLILANFTILSDPQYYNYNNGTIDNSFPFGITTGMMIQTLIGPGEFNTPVPAPNGNITGISFRISATYPIPNVTYSVFRILLLDTTLTSLPTNLLTGNWDTVYYRASVLFNAPVNTWLDITLDHPHAYNNTRSLAVQIEQCSAPLAVGFPLRHTNTPGFNRRTYSTGGCPFTYGGTSSYVSNVGISIALPPPLVPNLLYYKFRYNPSPASTYNCAIPGAGYYIAPFSGLSFSGGGQFDSCIAGTGIAGGGINTGWNFNRRGNSWTISMWLNIPTTTSGSAFYLFGDTGAGAFRCYHNGTAGPNNLVLRGNFNDVIVPDIGPSPTVVTFVYDSAAGNIKAYKNGALVVTSNQILNIPLGTGLKAGGYGSMQTFVGKMDEFRVYWTALLASEVQSNYNYNIFVYCPIIGIKNLNIGLPVNYMLYQNYPNPFNPATQISFAIPLDGLTKLAVHDILGKEIYTLVYSYLKAGNYSASFNAENIASGTYFYTLTSGNFLETKKMVIVK
jgi:hypothetical protein